MQSTPEALRQEHASAAAKEGAALRALMEPEPYRQTRAAHVLRTKEAFRWLTRTHQRALVEAGALVKISGRWMVHADRFDLELVRIGEQSARAGLPGARG